MPSEARRRQIEKIAMSQLASVVFARRDSAGLTLDEAARAWGVSERTLRQIENQQGNPSLSSLCRLAAGMGMTSAASLIRGGGIARAGAGRLDAETAEREKAARRRSKKKAKQGVRSAALWGERRARRKQGTPPPEPKAIPLASGAAISAPEEVDPYAPSPEIRAMFTLKGGKK